MYTYRYYYSLVGLLTVFWRVGLGVFKSPSSSVHRCCSSGVVCAYTYYMVIIIFLYMPDAFDNARKSSSRFLICVSECKRFVRRRGALEPGFFFLGVYATGVYTYVWLKESIFFNFFLLKSIFFFKNHIYLNSIIVEMYKLQLENRTTMF